MIELGELILKKGGSVDPLKFPDEKFQYYSIPAYDKNEAEIVYGKEIGSSKKLFLPNDVLLSRIVPHIRRCWIVGVNNGYRQIGSSEWITFRSDKITPSFLRFYLMSNDFNDKFLKTIKGVGGSLMRADPSQVAKFKIPLPPIEQQKKISAILYAADSYRQKTKSLIAKYDELTQSLFLDMFGDPVKNEKGWELVKFSDVGILDRGKSKHRPRNAPELLGGIYPLIQTGDIAKAGCYITEYKSTYSELGLAQSKLWNSGTLCITIAANIAKTGILTFDACFPDSVVGFSPNKKTNNEYTQYWMSFLQKIIEDSAPESAQKNINLAILKNLNFPLAPIKIQNQFAEHVQAIEKQKAQAKISLDKAEELFNSLLQRAFKGELV